MFERCPPKSLKSGSLLGGLTEFIKGRWTHGYGIKDIDEGQPREPALEQVQEGSMRREAAAPSHGVTQVTSRRESYQPGRLTHTLVSRGSVGSITHPTADLLEGGTPAPKP